MSERVQQPDATQKLVRRYGVQGLPGLRLENIVYPVCLVDDLSGETQELASCAAQAFVGALAANVSEVQILNPANSGVVTLVRQIFITSGNASTAMRVRELDTALATGPVAQTGFRDRRLTGVPTTQLFTGQNAASSGGTALWVNDTDAGGIVHLRDTSIVLTAGQGIVVTTGAQNMSVTACFWWEERKAQPGELVGA